MIGCPVQSRARSLLVATCLLGGGVALAQPQQADKVDAKALMQSGLKLLEAKDYLGALAVFKDAYARFPSAKILLNIGTTLNLLDRKVDAANAYQRYLDAPDTDPAKQSNVTAALYEIDKLVGALAITVTPPDAEVEINDGDWAPAASVHVYRVPGGQFTVRARKDKFQSEAKSASINTGEKAAIVINLTALPQAAEVSTLGTARLDDEVVTPTEPEEGRSRLGGLALAHLDPVRGGGAALVGLTFDIASAFQVQGTAILGPTYGAYGGASFAVLDGTYRPFVAAGMPIFFSNGARVGVRAAGGLELVITRHVSLIAELGGELMLNPEDNILKVAFIPAIGAGGRL